MNPSNNPTLSCAALDTVAGEVPARRRAVRLESHALFAGAREAIIVHHGEEYRLRITRREKLILTK